MKHNIITRGNEVIGCDLVPETKPEEKVCKDLQSAFAEGKGILSLTGKKVRIAEYGESGGGGEVSFKIDEKSMIAKLAALLADQRLKIGAEMAGYKGRTCKIRLSVPGKKDKRKLVKNPYFRGRHN